MSPLFWRKPKKSMQEINEREPEAEHSGDPLEDSIAAIARQGSEEELQEVVSEVEESIKMASKTALRDLRFQVAGRCPQCGQSTRSFIQTQVCSYCGWASFATPTESSTIVHTLDKREVKCEQAFRTGDGDVLCIRENVVCEYVPRANLSHIQYDWTPEEREKRRRQDETDNRYLCAWCEKEVEPEVVVAQYAAFGTHQHRYTFCGETCRDAFRKQYPSRIHRNCYETDCEECDKCIKRYDRAEQELRTHSYFVKAADARPSSDGS